MTVDTRILTSCGTCVSVGFVDDGLTSIVPLFVEF
jgi:hypothetical protein